MEVWYEIQAERGYRFEGDFETLDEARAVVEQYRHDDVAMFGYAGHYRIFEVTQTEREVKEVES